MTQLWWKLWRHPGHLVWVAAAYFPLLGWMNVPLTGDQKVYLSTAMEMREAGSWLKPLLFGEGSYYKPPFQYWATLVGWELFGFNLWGALIPSVLCVLATAWFVGELAYLMRERRWFVNAGLWFAATLGTVTYGTTGQMEIYLCLFYAASWWAGLRFLAEPRESRRPGWLYAAFAIAGLAAIVKSPLYSVFWVVGYLSYLIVSGEWELFSNKHLYRAWGIGIVVGAAWFVAILAVDGQRFWADYALRETWYKKGGNQSTFLSLWGALLYFCFPFTLMLIPAVRAMLRSRRTGEILRFVLCWSWLPAIFFSVYPYRIKPYLYLLVPALAVLVDWGYFRAGRTILHRSVTIGAGIFMLFILGGVAFVLARAELVPYWVCGGLAAAGLAGLVCAGADWMRGFALSGLAAIFFFRAAAGSLGEQDIAGLREAVASKPAAPVAMLDENRNIWHEVGLMAVGIGKPVRRLSNVDEVAEFVRAGGIVALTEEQAAGHLRTVQAKLLGKGDLRDLDVRAWKRWKVRARFPYRELVARGRRGVPDFENQVKREFSLVSVR
jgi:4-amino-4-deoxy-L-arabinose transferase-like glycosyltransferase